MKSGAEEGYEGVGAEQNKCVKSGKMEKTGV